MTLPFAVSDAALLAVVVGYYAVVVGRGGDVAARRLLHGAVGRSGRAVDEVDSVVRMAMAAAMQLAFACVLVAVLGVSVAELVPDELRLELVLLGVVLGAGEALLGSFLGTIAMRVAAKLAPQSAPADAAQWLTVGRGGWMRLFLRTAEAAPLRFGLVVMTLYIAVEEVIFRGVLISYLDEGGAAVALTLSVLAFVAVQVFSMPSWHAAIFPVVGALVVGVVHGSLYLAVPDLLPLVVAHLVLFAVAVA
jgi:hypothetical protein